MKKHWLIVAAVLIAALLATATPVAASTPLEVHIYSVMYLNEADPIGPMSGTFTAVGTDLICPSGTVQDIANPAYAWQSDKVLVLDVHKHFVCDGSGDTFEMNMRVLIGPNGTAARWVIAGGDGPYARLFGAGGLTGIGQEDGSVVDTYSGKLHIE